MFYENVVAAPRLRQLDAGLSRRRPGLDPKPLSVGSVVHKVWQEDNFLLKVPRFFRHYNSTNAPLVKFHDAI
jgi:hypothetical protein